MNSFSSSLEIEENSFIPGILIFGRIFLYMNKISLEIEENSFIPGILIFGRILLYLNPSSNFIGN